MTTDKQIYRGYDIEQRDGAWVVSKDGVELVTHPRSEEAAMNWVDTERKQIALERARSRG